MKTPKPEDLLRNEAQSLALDAMHRIVNVLDKPPVPHAIAFEALIHGAAMTAVRMGMTEKALFLDRAAQAWTLVVEKSKVRPL